jgi:hypothetical protein
MNVETIRALWRGMDAARAQQFEDAGEVVQHRR